MTKHAIFLLTLAIVGCGDSKSGDTDTDAGTGTDTGTATDNPTGPGSETGTGTETGTESDTDTGAPTGTGGDQPVQVDASGCLPQCVEDVDAQTPTIETDCTVCDYDPVQHTCAAIVKCESVMGAWTIPAGQEACFAVHWDSGNDTPSEIDNLSQTCLDAGSNAQIEIVRNGEAPAGTFPAAICSWSTSPATDCPDL